MLKRTFLNGTLFCLLLSLCQFLPHSLLAQGRADNNWFFGSTGQGIRFNFSDDSLASDPLNTSPLGQGSSAVATDPRSGDVLFYTDGSQIYQADGTPFPGVTLPGDPAGNQQVAITPDPANPDSYFVYVIDANGDVVYYTVTVDRTARGVPTVSNVTGPATTDMTGAATLLVVPNPQDNSFWLISQLAGTATYQYLEVTNAGPQPSQTYSAGTDGAQPITATGTTYNPATGRFAAAGPQGLHILDFDPQSGAFQYINHNTIAAYDVAFSPDGSKLYVTNGPGNQVSQYNLENQPPTPTPLPTGLSGISGIFGIQQGPDGSVYFLYENGGASQLGRINFADSAVNLLTYETALLNGTDFGGRRFSQSGPAATPNYNFAATSVGNCTNNPVQIIPQFDPSTPEPDSIVWDIGGERFVGLSPNFTPEQAVAVSATAYWPDTSVSTSVTPQLGQFDLQVPLVQDTTICPGDSATLNAEPEGGGQGGGGGAGGGVGGGGGTGGNYTYYWSTGETTPEIVVNEAAVYWVLVTDPATGCTAYAESNVKEYQVENQTYNVWYFGDGAGIDFNTLYDDPDDPDDGQITPIGDGALNAPEGVAAVSDSNGDILFYTDGQTVYFYDRETQSHVALPDENGNPVQISESNESTMVGMVQVPGSDGMFYVFTATPADNSPLGYELRYSIVDLKQRAVVSSNNLLFSRSTERITIEGGRGGAATLIVHEYGSNTFRAYPITDQGIGNPVLSSVGSVHELDDPAEATGYMKTGGDSTGTILAVAIPSEDDPRVELFNFDNETLEFSDPVSVSLSGLNAQPYGVEVAADSLGNTVVYVTTDNGIYGATITGDVDPDDPPNFVLVNGTGGQTFGAIQQAPDGQLYVVQPGRSNLGTVAFNPNDVANSTFTPDGLQSPFPENATTGLGLPNYIDQGGNSFPEPSITVDDACVGNEINFSAQGRDDVIETYFWTIERIGPDGNALYSLGLDSATEQSFTMQIDTVGLYRASVLLSNPCDTDTVLVQEFNVGQSAEIILPESANLCNGSVELTAIDPATPDIGDYTFEWIQEGAVGGGNLPAQNTITVDEGATYRVRVTNADGCENEGEVFVFDNRPEINLPEDFTLCQNETRELDVEIPSPGDPGYEWVILDTNDQQVAASNEPVIEVSELTPDPGVYRYTVTVTDDSPEGCFIQDTVVVTIEEAPVINVTPQATTNCGEDDGAVNLVFPDGDDPSQFTYSWTDAAGTVISTSQNLTGVGGGNYTVTVTNSQGCSTTANAGVQDQNADFAIQSVTTTDSGCEDDEGVITVTLDTLGNTGVIPVTWRLTGSGVAPLSGTGPNNDVTFNILGLSAGFYNLEVESQGGCVQTETDIEVPVNQDSVQFEFVQDPVTVCGATAEIEVAYDPLTDGNWIFRWFAPDGSEIPVNNPGRNILSLNRGNNPPGVYRVEVENRSDPPLCPGSREVTVNYGNPFTVDIATVEPDNSCETGERQLTVNFDDPDAANLDLIYSWRLNGVEIGASRTVTVTESGSYEVRVRERNSACFSNDELPVDVSEPLNVNVIFGNTCADGSAIPLFAAVNVSDTTLSYSWFNPQGDRIPAANTRGDSLFVESDMAEGQYRVEVSSTTGCTAQGTATIRRNPQPEVELGPSRTICTQDPDPEINSVELEVGTATEIYWNTPKGEFFNTTTVIADVPGTYTVELTNQFGCVTTDSVEVVDDCHPRIVAPNAFRPGGVNNEFFVYSRYVASEDFEVKIYNRWGELIYYSTSPDFRWDGTYKGKPAPLGTYPYVINYRSSTSGDSGEILEERGGITIVR